MDVAIETDSQDLVDQLHQIDGLTDVQAAAHKGIDGQSLITAIVAITSATATPVAQLIKAHIESKKYVKVTRNGVTIHMTGGVPDEMLIRLLSEKEEH